MLLLSALPATAQTTNDSLQQLLEARDAEIERLRARIAELEGVPSRGTTAPVSIPSANSSQSSPEATADAGEGDHALERALVRQGGLLLPKGAVEIEPNFAYSHTSTESNHFRRDAYGPGLAARWGLPYESQLDISSSYVIERRRSDTAGSSRSDGIGDVSLGLSHQFFEETDSTPAFIGFVGYTFATGENTVFSSSSPVGHGAGFDSANVGLTLVKRIDPLVYFGSYTYAHSFSGEQGGNSADLGNSHGFRLGTLLAASPTTSLRAAFNLTFFDKTRFNGAALSGTDEPSAMLELGSAILISPTDLLDVGVGAGLTRSAPDFRLTVAYPVRF